MRITVYIDKDGTTTITDLPLKLSKLPKKLGRRVPHRFNLLQSEVIEL